MFKVKPSETTDAAEHDVLRVVDETRIDIVDGVSSSILFALLLFLSNSLSLFEGDTRRTVLFAV